VSDYDERLQHAYKATTYGDLDHVIADLPVTVDDQQSQLMPAGSYYPAQASTSWLTPLQTMAAWRVLFFGLLLLMIVTVLVGGLASVVGR
jgi:hypothetical protein